MVKFCERSRELPQIGTEMSDVITEWSFIRVLKSLYISLPALLPAKAGA